MLYDGRFFPLEELLMLLVLTLFNETALVSLWFFFGCSSRKLTTMSPLRPCLGSLRILVLFLASPRERELLPLPSSSLFLASPRKLRLFLGSRSPGEGELLPLPSLNLFLASPRKLRLFLRSPRESELLPSPSLFVGSIILVLFLRSPRDRELLPSLGLFFGSPPPADLLLLLSVPVLSV